MSPTEHRTKAARLAAQQAGDPAAPGGEVWEAGAAPADGHPTMTSPAKSVTHSLFPSCQTLLMWNT